MAFRMRKLWIKELLRKKHFDAKQADLKEKDGFRLSCTERVSRRIR